MAFLFENLDVYQKAVAFADEISDLTEGFSKGSYYLTDHLNRAALSIATNIYAGFNLSSAIAEVLKLGVYCYR